MWRLKSIALTNIVSYEQAFIKFDAPVYVVRGLNRDRKSKDSRNAVGKTLFFSTIPTSWYFTPPSAQRKNAAKSVHEKDSVIEIGLQRGKQKVFTRQEQHGRSLKASIRIGKKVHDYRELNKAKEHITKLIGVPDEQFYAFNYIANNRPHPLLYGRAPQRFEFFENIFDLDVHDLIFEEISKIYNDMKIEGVALKTLKERYALESDNNNLKVDVADLRAKRKRYRERVEKLSDDTAEQQSHIQSVRSFLSVLDGEEPISKSDADKSREQLERHRKSEASLNKLFRRAIEINALHDAYDASRQQRTVVRERMKKYGEPPSDLDKQKERAKRYDLLRRDLRDLVRSYAGAKDEVISARRAFNELDRDGIDKYVRDDRVTLKAFDKLEKKIYAIEASLEKFGKLKAKQDSKCYVCGQPLDQKHIDTEIERLDADRIKLRKLRSAWKDVFEYRKRQDALLAAVAVRDEAKLKGLDLKKKYDKARIAKKVIERFEKYSSLSKQLKALTLDKPTSKRVDAEGLEKELDRVRHKIKREEGTLQTYRSIKGLDVTFATLKKAEAALKDGLEKLDSINKPLKTYNRRLEKITTQLAQHKATSESLATLQYQIVKSEKRLKDFPIYEKLRDAYGARGLRLFRINELATRYIENLNTLSHLIYSEKITFSHKITKGAFDIYAQRNVRGNKLEDIHSLSGSEGKAFVALTILALMPLIPAHKRLGFVIFDEIESNMDTPTRTLLIEEFLPVLQRVMPLIVFVTPEDKTRFFIHDAKELLVTKKDGVSTITEG